VDGGVDAEAEVGEHVQGVEARAVSSGPEGLDRSMHERRQRVAGLGDQVSLARRVESGEFVVAVAELSGVDVDPDLVVAGERLDDRGHLGRDPMGDVHRPARDDVGVPLHRSRDAVERAVFVGLQVDRERQAHSLLDSRARPKTVQVPPDGRQSDDAGIRSVLRSRIDQDIDVGLPECVGVEPIVERDGVVGRFDQIG
jgi:hypothetical protein